MGPVILAFARATPEDLPSTPLPPAWRKATRNMILTCTAIERSWGRIRGKADVPASEIGIVLHTSSGELEASADFLASWAQQGLARPLLFQNSLHNATTGFASIAYGIAGPSVTVSSSSGDALRAAQSLLQGQVCRICLVVAVEVHRRMRDLLKEPGLSEGAAALVLANADDPAIRNLSRKEMGFSNLDSSDDPEGRGGKQPLVPFADEFLDRAVRSLAGDPA